MCQLQLVQEHGGGRAAAFRSADHAVEGPLLLDDVAHVLERQGDAVVLVLGGPIFRPDAAPLVFRLGEVVERQHVNQSVEAFVDRDDGVVEVDEIGRRALVFDVGRGFDVVQTVDEVEACSVVRFEVSPQVVLRLEG